MVASTIRMSDPNLPEKEVTRARVRSSALSRSHLYTQGKVKHTGHFPDLERQMLQFSTAGYKGAKLPDRADACIWLCTELMAAEPTTGVLN